MSDTKFSIFSHYPFFDLNIYQYGYEKCDSLHSFGPSVRNHYLFHYVLSGKGTLIASGKNNEDVKYEIKPHEGFLIFPDQVTTYMADQDEPWEYVWVEFDGLIVKDAIAATGLSMDEPIYIPENENTIIEIEKTLTDLIKTKSKTPYKKIGQLYYLFDNLSIPEKKRPTTISDKVSDYYVTEMINFIENHFEEDITIEDMANHLNLSRGHINKIFKQFTGKTPKEFLTRLRMTKATHLLKTTKLPIGEIGAQIGYNNQLHFSRAFKNYFGISPKMWRQMNTWKDN